MTPRRTKFYLDKRNAKWLGVCSGLADYTGLDVTLVRVGMVVLTVVGGFPWTLIAYWAAAWMANDKPGELAYDSAEERRFWQDVRTRPGNSVRDVRSRFRDIDRRLSDLEVYYTSHNRRLADEIDSLR
ncbi:envelope stress response membrane protein PspC [Sphingomonas morindae]|uniref:Envelope stress response membrane protein PspC n=1 Tax=Sphingomonas morindae TaxID=1541170 RepID=A0ABY4X818_9SPHN|nr:envelope stress response membrane protein PspC [Sphingomonas morindae]USI73088.1 envelope stress response membrane protein PspC [Sphingomonas morindae]